MKVETTKKAKAKAKSSSGGMRERSIRTTMFTPTRSSKTFDGDALTERSDRERQEQ